MTRKPSVGGILGEIFALLRDAGRAFALYTLVVGGLAAFGALAGLSETAAGQLNFGFRFDSSDTPASALFELVSLAVSIFGTYLLLVRFLAVRGRLHADGGRFWPYLGMAILSALGTILGFVLLLIPGFLLMVRWSAASGFVIGAGEGVTESLSSSWNATQGHGWAIFFATVIPFVGLVVASAVIDALLTVAGASVVEVASAFVEAAAGGVFAAFGIAVYCCVHDDAREISEVFA
jgi:hypothetical protein